MKLPFSVGSVFSFIGFTISHVNLRYSKDMTTSMSASVSIAGALSYVKAVRELEDVIIPEMVNIAKGTPDPNTGASHQVKQFLQDHKFSVWSVIINHVNEASHKIHIKTPELGAFVLRGALVAGIDVFPTKEDLEGIADYIHIYGFGIFDTLIEVLQECFREDTFMCGFLQAIFYTKNTSNIMYISTHGTFIFDDNIMGFVSEFSALDGSRKKLINPLAIADKKSMRMYGSINVKTEAKTKGEDNCKRIIQITIGDAIIPVLGDMSAKYAELLQKVLKHFRILDETMAWEMGEKEDIYHIILRDELKTYPLDPITGKLLIEQGEGSMCKPCSVWMAGCGVAVRPETAKTTKTCGCYGHLGGCGKFTELKITSKTPYPFLEETLRGAVRTVKKILVKEGCGSVESASEETRAQILKIVTESRERVETLMSEHRKRCEEKLAELAAKKAKEELSEKFKPIRKEEMIRRWTLVREFHRDREQFLANIPLLIEESDKRASIDKEFLAFWHFPTLEVARHMRVITLAASKSS